jgi:hypothetical protein
MFQAKFLEKLKHFLFNSLFSKSRSIYEIMWKNIVQLEMPKMTVGHEACAFYAGQIRIEIFTEDS